MRRGSEVDWADLAAYHLCAILRADDRVPEDIKEAARRFMEAVLNFVEGGEEDPDEELQKLVEKAQGVNTESWLASMVLGFLVDLRRVKSKDSKCELRRAEVVSTVVSKAVSEAIKEIHPHERREIRTLSLIHSAFGVEDIIHFLYPRCVHLLYPELEDSETIDKMAKSTERATRITIRDAINMPSQIQPSVGMQANAPDDVARLIQWAIRPRWHGFTFIETGWVSELSKVVPKKWRKRLPPITFNGRLIVGCKKFFNSLRRLHSWATLGYDIRYCDIPDVKGLKIHVKQVITESMVMVGSANLTSSGLHRLTKGGELMVIIPRTGCEHCFTNYMASLISFLRRWHAGLQSLVSVYKLEKGELQMAPIMVNIDKKKAMKVVELDTSGPRKRCVVELDLEELGLCDVMRRIRKDAGATDGEARLFMVRAGYLNMLLVEETGESSQDVPLKYVSRVRVMKVPKPEMFRDHEVEVVGVKAGGVYVVPVYNGGDFRNPDFGDERVKIFVKGDGEMEVRDFLEKYDGKFAVVCAGERDDKHCWKVRIADSPGEVGRVLRDLNR